MRTLGLITSIGPDADLELFRVAARSVLSVPAEVRWHIAVPPSINGAVRDILYAEIGEAVPVRVEVMQTANIALARNVLLRGSQDNYVMQFDADDVLVGAGVSELLRDISSRQMPWGAGPFLYFTEDACPSQLPRNDVLGFDDRTIPSGFIAHARNATRDEFPCGSIAIHPGACIFRKDILVSVGGWDETLGSRWEDYVPLALVSGRNEGVWSPLPTLLYRKGMDSVTGQGLSDDEIDYFEEYLSGKEES